MNQRIQELASQSGLYITIANGKVYPQALSAEQCVSAYNKFAELIVLECVHLTDTLNESYDAPSTAGKFIKDHFGMDT